MRSKSLGDWGGLYRSCSKEVDEKGGGKIEAASALDRIKSKITSA